MTRRFGIGNKAAEKRLGFMTNESRTIHIFVYNQKVKSSEFKRWLEKQGATFTPGKGSHFRVSLNGKNSVLPMHSKDMKKGTVEGIKKDLGLK
jgi:mRNA interferase HicA